MSEQKNELSIFEHSVEAKHAAKQLKLHAKTAQNHLNSAALQMEARRISNTTKELIRAKQYIDLALNEVAMVWPENKVDTKKAPTGEDGRLTSNSVMDSHKQGANE